MAPSAAPAPTTVCSSSMNSTTSLQALDLVQHALEALLELAAVLGPGHHAAQVRASTRLPRSSSGTSSDHDLLGQAVGDGGLAHAGLADEHGVVLGARD